MIPQERSDSLLLSGCSTASTASGGGGGGGYPPRRPWSASSTSSSRRGDRPPACANCAATLGAPSWGALDDGSFCSPDCHWSVVLLTSDAPPPAAPSPCRGAGGSAAGSGPWAVPGAASRQRSGSGGGGAGADAAVGVDEAGEAELRRLRASRLRHPASGGGVAARAGGGWRARTTRCFGTTCGTSRRCGRGRRRGVGGGRPRGCACLFNRRTRGRAGRLLSVRAPSAAAAAGVRRAVWFIFLTFDAWRSRVDRLYICNQRHPLGVSSTFLCPTRPALTGASTPAAIRSASCYALFYYAWRP